MSINCHIRETHGSPKLIHIQIYIYLDTLRERSSRRRETTTKKANNLYIRNEKAQGFTKRNEMCSTKTDNDDGDATWK